MADHDQLCGHTGGVVPIDSDCWDDNFFVQAQHYEQLWLELVTPSCHPPSPWTWAPCPVLGVQKDCNCNHESHVLICFKAMQVISRFTSACKFHSEVCGYGIQIPTMIWFTRLIYKLAVLLGYLGLNLFLINSCIRRLTDVLLRYQAAGKFGFKFILI